MRPLNFPNKAFLAQRWRLHAVMDFLLVFSVLFFNLRLTFANQNQGVKPFYEHFRNSSLVSPSPKLLRERLKRSPFHKITECIFVTSEENYYFYKSENNNDDVCGVYLFTDPDKVVEIHFDYLNVPCTTGGLITFFDGWELKGKFFPRVDDHEKPFLQRYKEFCGVEKIKKVFVTTQNAGMLHYRIPEKGKGFSFYVKFLKNPTPCNILVESKEEFYTLRNHGKANNCTLIAVFPAKIQLLSLAVGVSKTSEQTGTIYECWEKNMRDGLQIGGSDNLDSSPFVLFKDVCGLDSFPGMNPTIIGCGVSIVRLVSTGRYDNSATLSVSQPDEDELMSSDYFCEV